MDKTLAVGEFILRVGIAISIVSLFVASNLFVLNFIDDLYKSDNALLIAGRITATERIVDNQVLMTLIGATTVQVGIIMVAISAYLFPKSKA